jgi:hypothetical protein
MCDFEARVARPCARCERSCSTLAYIMMTSQCSIRASIRPVFTQKYKSNPFCECLRAEIAFAGEGIDSTGAAHRQAFDLQRGLSNANRNTLPFLAAGSYAIVEPKVVPDHGDPC